jgi:multiple sugar transport system substrate-binding protein
MRGKLRSTLVAIAAGTLVVGGALVPAQAAPKPVTITYFTFSAVPDHLDTLKAQIAAFHKANPTINVKVQTAAYADYFTKLKTQVAGGTAPDVFDLNYENFVTYAKAGALLNLNAQAKADKAFKKSVYYGKAYDVFRLGSKQFGLPASYSTTVLFYNKDLFAKAGVATPAKGWDWSDEESAAEALKAKLPAGSYADYQGAQFWEFYKSLGQAGGHFFDPKTGKAAFNKLPGVNALNWLVGKVQKGYMPTTAQMSGMNDEALFKAGKLAMWHSGIWEFAPMASTPFQWDIANEPQGAVPGNFFFANSVVASAKSKNAAAAWKWMKFFTSDPKSVKLRVDAAWEVPAISAKAPLASYLNQRPPTNRQAVLDALKNPIVPPVITQQSQLQDTMNAWIEKAMNGTVSVSTALNSAAADVNALLANE